MKHKGKIVEPVAPVKPEPPVEPVAPEDGLVDCVVVRDFSTHDSGKWTQHAKGSEVRVTAAYAAAYPQFVKVK